MPNLLISIKNDYLDVSYYSATINGKNYFTQITNINGRPYPYTHKDGAGLPMNEILYKILSPGTHVSDLADSLKPALCKAFYVMNIKNDTAIENYTRNLVRVLEITGYTINDFMSALKED